MPSSTFYHNRPEYSILTPVNGYIAMFSGTFTKGNNFCDSLFASSNDEYLSEWVLLLEENFCWLASEMVTEVKMAELLPLKE